jgi:hypothetical protein
LVILPCWLVPYPPLSRRAYCHIMHRCVQDDSSRRSRLCVHTHTPSDCDARKLNFSSSSSSSHVGAGHVHERDWRHSLRHHGREVAQVW